MNKLNFKILIAMFLLALMFIGSSASASVAYTNFYSPPAGSGTEIGNSQVRFIWVTVTPSNIFTLHLTEKRIPEELNGFNQPIWDNTDNIVFDTIGIRKQCDIGIGVYYHFSVGLNFHNNIGKDYRLAVRATDFPSLNQGI